MKYSSPPAKIKFVYFRPSLSLMMKLDKVSFIKSFVIKATSDQTKVSSQTWHGVARGGIINDLRKNDALSRHIFITLSTFNDHGHHFYNHFWFEINNVYYHQLLELKYMLPFLYYIQFFQLLEHPHERMMYLDMGNGLWP